MMELPPDRSISVELDGIQLEGYGEFLRRRTEFSEGCRQASRVRSKPPSISHAEGRCNSCSRACSIVAAPFPAAMSNSRCTVARLILPLSPRRDADTSPPPYWTK